MVIHWLTCSECVAVRLGGSSSTRRRPRVTFRCSQRQRTKSFELNSLSETKGRGKPSQDKSSRPGPARQRLCLAI